jgi:hypothetical protein
MRLAGEALPAHIAEPPELIAGLDLFLDAFFELDTERNHSFDFMRIPWSSVIAYCNEYAIENEQRDDMIYFILRIDEAHINRLVRRREQNKEGNGNVIRPSGAPRNESGGARSNR